MARAATTSAPTQEASAPYGQYVALGDAAAVAGVNSRSQRGNPRFVLLFLALQRIGLWGTLLKLAIDAATGDGVGAARDFSALGCLLQANFERLNAPSDAATSIKSKPEQPTRTARDSKIVSTRIVSKRIHP
jgi:hypothetical protein